MRILLKFANLFKIKRVLLKKFFSRFRLSLAKRPEKPRNRRSVIHVTISLYSINKTTVFHEARSDWSKTFGLLHR